MISITGVVGLNDQLAAGTEATGGALAVPSTYSLDENSFVLAATNRDSALTQISIVANGTASANYTYSAPLSANAGEHVATVVDTVGSPFGSVLVGDTFTDKVSGLKGFVLAATSGTSINVQFESEPPVNAANRTFSIVRESHAQRFVEAMLGGRPVRVVTTMTLAAILAALNAVSSRFASVRLTGINEVPFSPGPVFNEVVIDRERIVRAALFGRGTFASTTEVGKARAQGIPTGVSQLEYEVGGSTRLFLIPTSYAKITNPGSGVSTHDNVANVTGNLAAFDPSATKNTLALRQSDYRGARTIPASLVAGVAQAIPDSARDYRVGGSDHTLAIDA